MAGKSVGSLYYEVILDSSKFARGATKLLSEQKAIRNAIKKTHATMDPAARLKLETDAEIKAIQLSRATAEQKKFLIDGVIDHHNKAMDAMYDKEKANSDRMVANKVREEKEKTDAIKREAEERRRMAAKAKVNAAIQAAESKGSRGYSAMLHGAGLGEGDNSIFGQIRRMGAEARKASTMWGRFSASMNKARLGIQNFVFAAFPVFVAFTAMKRIIGGLIKTYWSFIKAADEKKKQMVTLMGLYHGNGNAVNKLRSELVAYARDTAFAVEETVALAIQMRALGYDVDSTIDSIKIFGKLAFGDKTKLKLIAKAAADVKANSKLMATEVRQFANAGVPLLIQLQTNMGKTALEVRDLMKQGKISAEDVEEALSQIAEGYGDVDKAGLATASGQLDALKEDWKEFKADLFGDDQTARSAIIWVRETGEEVGETVKDMKEMDTMWWAIGKSYRYAIGTLTGGWSEAARLIRGIKEESYDLWVWMRGGTRGEQYGYQDELDQQKRFQKDSEANWAEWNRRMALLNKEKAAAQQKIDDEKYKKLEEQRKLEKAIMDAQIAHQRKMDQLFGVTGASQEASIADAYKNAADGVDPMMLARNEKTYQLESAAMELVNAVEKGQEEMASLIDGIKNSLPNKSMRADSVEAWIYEKERRDRIQENDKKAAALEAVNLKREREAQELLDAVRNISLNNLEGR